MLTLRIFFLIAGITATAASSEFTLKCYITYLRAHYSDDPLFSGIESVGDFTQCSHILSSTFDRLYQKFNSSQSFYDCMKTNINRSGVEVLFIIAEADSLAPRDFKTYTEELVSATKKRQVNRGLRVAQEACRNTSAKEDIAAEFDRTVKDNKDKTFSETQEYCVKKHLISLGILDSNVYSSDVGNCDSLISTLQENSYRERQKHISDCITGFYRQNSLIEQYMKIEYVVAKIDLTPVEMSLERDRFVQTVYTIMEKAKKACNV